MEEEDFSKKLLYRVVALKNASDIVRFSFIVQKSISYLDLKPSEEMMVLNNTGTSCRGCASEESNYFINTEEKCRKYFIPSRSLLYNLHLDLPKGRESNLEEFKKYDICDFSEDAPHVSKITPICGFYDQILYDFITEIIEDNSKKLHILKWLLKKTDSGKPLLYYLEIETARIFIDAFYPTITVPELFKNFIMHLDITEWMTTYEEPEIVEYLLYYARHFGRTYLMEVDGDFYLIDICVFNHLFKNISPILKYTDAPRIPTDEYFQYPMEIVRPDLDEEEFNEEEKQIKEERFYLINQLIWIYDNGGEHHDADESLEIVRLIWHSLPYPFVSLNEIKGIFEEEFSFEKLECVYDFYARAIGEFYEVTEPRTLQHLCRTVIRRTLRENEIWIPDGVKRMGLSKRLQSFLNLEETFVTANEF